MTDTQLTFDKCLYKRESGRDLITEWDDNVRTGAKMLYACFEDGGWGH